MRKSKKKKIGILGFLAILCFICLLLLVGIMSAIIVSILVCLFVALNLYAKKKISWNADHMFSDIGRNYDYLLIGEPWDYSELNGKTIVFFSPNRSMLSCCELTRRLYSLLKEESGTVVVSCQERNFKSQRISVLDVPYLHETQLRKYHITHAKLKKFFPLLFAPIETIKFMMAKKQNKMQYMDNNIYPAIANFCQERNIKIEIIKTK